MRISLLLVAGTIAFHSSFALGAKKVNLPDTLALTAYGTGSTGYSQMVSLGSLLQNKYNTSLRILPGENDISRMTPLRTDRVPLCACGIASYYSAEGVLMFADRKWGPQPLRVISTAISGSGMGVAVAGDIGVKTPYDLKGKRVSYVRGDDALNLGTEAFLAFGGLSWDDVEKVEYPGYGRVFDGIIADQADTVLTSSIASGTQQMAASPRSIVWPELDPNDKEGWARMQKVAPYFQPHNATVASGDYGKDKPWVGATYPYPIIVGNVSLDHEIASSLIRVLIEDFDLYKDSAPGNDGYSLENQNMKWVIPFHEAVVEYYKEIGHWTDEMQAHQDSLLQRQQILQDTWTAFSDNNPPEDADAFRKGWMKARAKALTAADMNPVFN